MKKILHIIAVALCCLLTSDSEVQAQDIHFSENYATPLMINPAMTGLFNGQVRVTGIYRNQWRSITEDAPYSTIGASIDMDAFKGVRAFDRISLGLMLYSDKAGDSQFSTNHVNLSMAYNVSFGINSVHSLSVGAMGGFAQRSLNYSALTFGSQFDGSGYNGTLPSGEENNLTNNNITFMDVSSGLLYYYAPSERMNIYGGLGIYHMNRPSVNFIDGNFDRLQAKSSMQIGGRFAIAKDFDLVPSAYFLKQGPNMKLDVGTFFLFLFERSRSGEKAVGLGVFSRVNGDEYDPIASDAVIGALRLDLNDITIGTSYDFNVSSLKEGTNGRGAVEIAVIYTSPARNRNRVLHCPRF